MSELFPEFMTSGNDITIENWRDWYTKKYPEAFDKLHSAILTEASDRDAFFNDQAIKFIESQKMIYTDVDNAEKHFNAMVNQCLECHAKKCGGPIPRIKKLMIN